MRYVPRTMLLVPALVLLLALMVGCGGPHGSSAKAASSGQGGESG